MEFSTQVVYDLRNPDREPTEDEVEKHNPSRFPIDRLFEFRERHFDKFTFREFTFDTGCGIGEYKYASVLGEKAFKEFMQAWMFDDRTEDGHTVGAPGLGVGLVPSITFRTEEYSYRIEATITPIPTKLEEKKFTYEDVVKRIHALAA
jgi:hypothetical protein